MKVIDQFVGYPAGQPVIIVAENVFAAQPVMHEDDDGTLMPAKTVDGSSIVQVISIGGFAVEVLVPKGQSLSTWLASE